MASFFLLQPQGMSDLFGWTSRSGCQGWLCCGTPGQKPNRNRTSLGPLGRWEGTLSLPLQWTSLCFYFMWRSTTGNIYAVLWHFRYMTHLGISSGWLTNSGFALCMRTQMAAWFMFRSGPDQTQSPPLLPGESFPLRNLRDLWVYLIE